MANNPLIDGALKKAKERYGGALSDADTFEIFSAETLLKKYGLSFDDLEDGIVDGADDGGIDSVYVFVNNALLSIDTELDQFKQPVKIDLYVIQSKRQKSFKESAVSKLKDSICELINLSADTDALSSRFNSAVCEKFQTYRDAVTNLASEFPEMNVHVRYCTIASADNQKITVAIPSFVAAVESVQPNLSCNFDCWGAEKLYEEAGRQNLMKKDLSFQKTPIMHQKCFVVLCRLDEYVDFITDADGNLIDALFEFNIRDYQGAAAVNSEITNTLANKDDDVDFWWLNNGVTILAEKAQVQDTQISLQNPLIVNGLQTSHVIHRHFEVLDEVNDERCVQVRVLEVDDATSRDRVIKATNSQTGIKPTSFYATEPFQRKIEDYLQQFSIFYDRRKSFWRNQGKSAAKIIGIDKLAQSVMAVLVERPHDARGRPTTLLKSGDTYNSLFSDDHDLAIYRVCAQLFFRVDQYFKQARGKVDPIYLNNLRFHLMMELSWLLNGSRPVHISNLSKLDVSSLTDATIQAQLEHVIEVFDAFGPTDVAAKDANFTQALFNASLVEESSLSSDTSTSAKPVEKPEPESGE